MCFLSDGSGILFSVKHWVVYMQDINNTAPLENLPNITRHNFTVAEYECTINIAQH